jgi:hypothetical protein
MEESVRPAIFNQGLRIALHRRGTTLRFPQI